MAGKPNVFDAARDAVAVLSALDADDQARALRFVADALGVGVPGPVVSPDAQAVAERGATGPERPGANPSPKDFLTQKAPQSKNEEVACLGYFLARYRDRKRWKPAELSALNDEAHGPSFVKVSTDV